MKIYTDVENYLTLKLIFASQNSETAVEIINTKSDERPVPYLAAFDLPILQVAAEKYIFSHNAACRLLLKKSFAAETEAKIDKWLEWESTQLQPNLHSTLISRMIQGKADFHAAEKVKCLLLELDTELADKKYIAGEELSAADICIWSSLYLLLTGKSAPKFDNLNKWFESLSSIPTFSTGVKRLYKNGITDATKKSLTALKGLPTSQGNLQGYLSEKLGGKKKQAAKTEIVSSSQPEVSQTITVSDEEIEKAVKSWLSDLSSCPKPFERNHPILPKKGCKNYLITSALPYVNNVPHLGNIIGCVLSADVFSRYCRLRNYNSLYISGTDEYGTATETKALEEGLTPQQICDKYTAIHAEIYKWFNIDFDHFGRTSTPEQTEISQDIFWKLHKRGYISKQSVEQLKCEKCNRFLADRFVEGTCPLCGYADARGDQCDACGKLINAVELKEPKCKICQNTPVIKSSDHLFLDLPQANAALNEHLQTVFKTGSWTSNAKNITSSWIRDGLKARCISRDLKWGTPVPLEGYTDKVFYVWFDAPIGYLSITANYTDQWEKWWKNPDQVELYNFLGKDNVPFHGVIFPCTCLGANDNYTIVKSIVATEYLNYEDGKFSKSRGVGVFGNQAQDTGIPADIFRFYLLYVRPESQDSVFSWDDFQLKNNSELLNNLGNFINRSLSFLAKSFDSVIQKITLNDEDKLLLGQINKELGIFIELMEQAKIRDSIRNILNISRYGNQYMQSNKPWVLVKGSDEEKSRAGSVISLAANISCLLSVLLQPFMPETSKIIQQQTNSPTDCNVIHENFVQHLKEGHKIGTPSPLFEKIMATKIEELRKRFSGNS